jgi:hypothetical protein
MNNRFRDRLISRGILSFFLLESGYLIAEMHKAIVPIPATIIGLGLLGCTFLYADYSMHPEKLGARELSPGEIRFLRMVGVAVSIVFFSVFCLGLLGLTTNYDFLGFRNFEYYAVVLVYLLIVVACSYFIHVIVYFFGKRIRLLVKVTITKFRHKP